VTEDTHTPVASTSETFGTSEIFKTSEQSKLVIDKIFKHIELSNKKVSSAFPARA